LVGASRAETEEPMRRWLSTEWDVAAWSESTIEHAIRGSVKECIEQLRAHIASGVHRLILIPYRYQPDQLEIIPSGILPALPSSPTGSRSCGGESSPRYAEACQAPHGRASRSSTARSVAGCCARPGWPKSC